MAFHDINPKKFAFLLAQGAHEGELRKFFTEAKIQLLQKGAKVQNLPHGREERIRTISEKLSRKTDDVLRVWFKKNISVAAPTPLDEVLMYLGAYFDERELLHEDESKAICRSALSYLFDDKPDEGLLSLLRRPLGASQAVSVIEAQGVDPTTEPKIEADPLASDIRSNDSSVPQNYQIAELLASIISGDEGAIDNALAPFADDTRVMVEVLLRLRDGETEAALEQMSALPQNGPESELVQSALARARHQRNATAIRQGVRVVIPQPLDNIPDADAYEIVGIHTNESETGAVFVQPLFLVLEGQLRLLSKEDCFHLFPESGSVMTKKSVLRRPPRRRELVHWRVAERDGVEGRTRFHMEAELNPLIEVIKISVPSSDPDEVRERIKAHAAAGRAESGQRVMFLLSDGVALASPKGVDFARDEAFDQPWQAWGSLETWLIEGRQYCMEVSLSSASNLDLSPLDKAFLKLLKNLEVEQKLTLTKTQRREISELIRNQSGGEIAQRAKRIASFMDQIAINAEQLDEVLNLLGAHGEVHRRVEELIAKEFEARQVDKVGVQAEIAALKRKKAELEKEARDIERRNRHQAESAAATVRDAFDQAMREGVATLANAEIFQVLTGANGIQSRHEPAEVVTEPPNKCVKRGALSAAEVKARLSILGVNGRKATILSALSDLASKSGVAMILRGGQARQCVQVLARQDRDSVAIFDIPMGLTSGDLLRCELANLAEVQGLAVLNADLSPFEIYGAELLDLLMEQVMTEASNPKPILMSCLGGDLSLPLPNALRQVALVVDLDLVWGEGQQLLEDVDPDATLLLPALRKRIAEALSEIEDTVRLHVEHVIVGAICLE